MNVISGVISDVIPDLIRDPCIYAFTMHGLRIKSAMTNVFITFEVMNEPNSL